MIGEDILIAVVKFSEDLADNGKKYQLWRV